MQARVTPLLYTGFAELGNTKKLTLFLRTIVERPHLALYVKSLSGWSLLQDPTVHVLGSEQHGHLPLGAQLTGTNESNDLIPAVQWPLHDKSAIGVAIEFAIRRFNPALTEDHWAKRILRPSSTYNNSTWDATVALVLCLLPNLEAIRIDTSDVDEDPIQDGGEGNFKYILRVLRSASVNGRRLVLPKLRTAHLTFTNCVYKSQFQRSLIRHLGPLKCVRYEGVAMARCPWDSLARRVTKIGYGFWHFRRQHLSPFEGDIEELSVIIRPRKSITNVCLPSRPFTTPLEIDRLYPSPVSSFPKLRVLTASANMLLGPPYALWSPQMSPLLSNLNFEEACQTAKYYIEQMTRFYKDLPKKIESLVIIDCPNAMYQCIWRLLESPRLPHNLKHIELAYTYPPLDKTGKSLAAMKEWMAGRDSIWEKRFPGAVFATKKRLEDLARTRGITLVQRIDEKYGERMEYEEAEALMDTLDY